MTRNAFWRAIMWLAKAWRISSKKCWRSSVSPQDMQPSSRPRAWNGSGKQEWKVLRLMVSPPSSQWLNKSHSRSNCHPSQRKRWIFTVDGVSQRPQGEVTKSIGIWPEDGSCYSQASPGLCLWLMVLLSSAMAETACVTAAFQPRVIGVVGSK